MRSRLAIPALLALLALAVLASLAFGELRLSFGQVLGALMGGGDDIARTVVRDFRLPRALVGLAVGAALGASGVVMQAFFRNPLASPGLLGVSSGGALGAVAVLALGPLLGFAAATLWALPLASILGAFAATGAVLLLAQRGAGTERLLLSGVALNALLGGLGYSTSSGSGFGSTTVSSLKAFQAVAGRSVRGSVDSKTWAALFMALNSTQPRIAGTAKVGQSVTVAAGSWGPGSVSHSYQWYRGKTAISGAHSTRYTVQAGDAGSTLSVKVSGLRTGYTVTARTSSTATVATASFRTAPAPKISGTAKVGRTLKATVGAWSPSGATWTYQWYRDSAKIKGATTSTYKLTKASKSHRITVRVTGRKSGYTTLSKTSPVTRRVTMP